MGAAYSFRVLASHTFTVLAELPLTMRLASALNATLVTPGRQLEPGGAPLTEQVPVFVEPGNGPVPRFRHPRWLRGRERPRHLARSGPQPLIFLTLLCEIGERGASAPCFGRVKNVRSPVVGRAGASDHNCCPCSGVGNRGLTPPARQSRTVELKRIFGKPMEAAGMKGNRAGLVIGVTTASRTSRKTRLA